MASPRDQRSEKAAEYRRLYRTKRWLSIRAQQLTHYPLCAMCLPRITAATVCDHADKDSKATEEGFFAGPFQSLCKTHHDSTRQREEKRGHMIGSDESGAPLDPRHPWNKG
jgi:5-methylcytosine-specific restriction protein A